MDPVIISEADLLRIEPGDVLVFKVPNNWPLNAVRRAEEYIESRIGREDIHILVVPEGIDLGVVRQWTE